VLFVKRPAQQKPALSQPDAACYLAALAGDAVGVVRALRRGADLPVLVEMGVLVRVAERGHAQVARLLIEAGADVNHATVNGRLTPLLMAARSGHAELIELLLEHGAWPGGDAEGAALLLRYAAGSGHTHVVRRLLEAGLDVNAATSKGATALMAAARCGCLETLDALLEAGADVDARTDRGWTPLRAAVAHGRGEAAGRLREAGARELELSFVQGFRDRLALALLRLAAWVLGLEKRRIQTKERGLYAAMRDR
jgi:ankyrin repeat protein